MFLNVVILKSQSILSACAAYIAIRYAYLNVSYITVVTDRPGIKYLHRYVRDPLAAAGADGPERWYDVGLTLMGDSSKDRLDILKIDQRNTYGCCEGMFNLWLQRDVEASWNKLITALRKNNLGGIADDLTAKLDGKLILISYYAK